MQLFIFITSISLVFSQFLSTQRQQRYRNWDKVYSIDAQAKTITTQSNFDEFKNKPYLTSYVDPTLDPPELAKYLQNNVITGAYNVELPKAQVLHTTAFDKPAQQCVTEDPPNYFLISHQGRKYFFNKQTLTARACKIGDVWRPITPADKDKCEKVSPQVYQDFKEIRTQKGKESTPYFYVGILPMLNQYATRIDREDTCCVFQNAPIVFSQGIIATCNVKLAFQGIRLTIANTRTESIFSCPCPQRCTMFLNTIIDVLIVDGRLRKSIYALKDLENVAQQYKLFQQQLQKKSVNINGTTITEESININYFESQGRCGTGRVKIGCQLTELSFASTLYLIHGPLMPNSLSKMYCTIDRLDVQDLTQPEQTTDFSIPATVQLGKTRFIVTGSDPTTSELILTEDPQFLSATMTVKPTVGSCSTSGGYKWNGNFTIVKDESKVPDCIATSNDLDWSPVCNITKLEPLQKVYLVDKKVHAKGVNCDDICPSATVCNSNQKSSPLYQACLGIAGDINRLLQVEVPVSVKLEAVSDGENIEDVLTLGFQQMVAEIQTVKLQETVSNGKLNADSLRDLFKETVALPKDETFFPDRSQAAKDLGLFKNAMYNSKPDMDHIAAFPWLAGWRFGRQINALSYTTDILISAYDDLQKTVNSNFQGLATALQAVNNQVKNNYESVTSLYELIKQTHDAYGNDLRKVGYQLSELEYMAAKLALVNQYFTKVLSRQSQLVTESQLFDIRVGTCRSRSPTCFGGQGTYLSHVEFETPRQRVLIVNYLGSKERCKQIFTANKICTGKDLAQVAPFGCRFEAEDPSESPVLTNLADGGPCHAPLINIQECQLPAADLQKLQLVNFQETLQLGFRQVNYTKVQFNEKIANITKFNTDINTIIESTKAVKSLDQIVSETTMLTLKSLLAQINAWSLWDIAKYFLIAFAVVLVGMFVVSALKFVAAIFIATKTNKS
uniref:Spike protein n=1 Tax=Serpentovirinae sp. TaxID=2661817 RepID=A0A5P9K4Y4_9NIDO|nr:spike protein [Serpentovirinae sp.]